MVAGLLIEAELAPAVVPADVRRGEGVRPRLGRQRDPSRGGVDAAVASADAHGAGLPAGADLDARAATSTSGGRPSRRVSTPVHSLSSVAGPAGVSSPPAAETPAPSARTPAPIFIASPSASPSPAVLPLNVRAGEARRRALPDSAARRSDRRFAPVATDRHRALRRTHLSVTILPTLTVRPCTLNAAVTRVRPARTARTWTLMPWLSFCSATRRRDRTRGAAGRLTALVLSAAAQVHALRLERHRPGDRAGQVTAQHEDARSLRAPAQAYCRPDTARSASRPPSQRAPASALALPVTAGRPRAARRRSP